MAAKGKADRVGTVTITFEDGKTQVIRNIPYSVYELRQRDISPYSTVSNILTFAAEDGAHTTVANKGLRSMIWRPKRQK